VIPAGTTLDVRLSTGLSSESSQAGDPFEGTLENAVVVGERVAIPKGADVKGEVTGAVKSGRLKNRAELWVKLTEISRKGETYQIVSSTTGHKEGSKTTRNILFIGGGAGGAQPSEEPPAVAKAPGSARLLAPALAPRRRC
jgi:hypothetical protein